MIVSCFYVERSTWVHAFRLRSRHCVILCLFCTTSTLLSSSGLHGETCPLIPIHNRRVCFSHTQTPKNNSKSANCVPIDFLNTFLTWYEQKCSLAVLRIKVVCVILCHSYRIHRLVLLQCSTRRGHKH